MSLAVLRNVDRGSIARFAPVIRADQSVSLSFARFSFLLAGCHVMREADHGFKNAEHEVRMRFPALPLSRPPMLTLARAHTVTTARTRHTPSRDRFEGQFKLTLCCFLGFPVHCNSQTSTGVTLDEACSCASQADRPVRHPPSR